MDSNFLKSLAEMRSKVYWLLSDFYLKKPDKKFLKELKQKLPENVEEFSDAIELIKSSLDDDLDDLSERLAVEFTRLFRGIKKGYSPPPPYESVYRGEERVMGETTLAVMKFYSEAGFGIIEEEEGPQDYIGVELKFMSLLCYKEMEAWGKDSEKAREFLELEMRFLREHILQWVPKFCQVVEAESKEPFYVGVARLTKRFVELDAENLEKLLEEVKV
ncbi:cytoplasmic chaperone TorD family protein [Ferroglobus placidus DSM 10642]|uniref:Cytoplasmic chaperone TorD family protein n=1 Tax=Ferroglobus placidus (strain DSM 10642 / AEDII12DO) TaxID=589924 RepID=D3RY45_FERPA|nr:molecular chaperone TorD family protein [Ferroglobus placidus]ADC65408.1 cytoplasmic chaperone TorD family protein [Ferroglobus placidus DSM 10642]